MPPLHFPRPGLLSAFRHIFALLILLDVLWWLWADRRLRPLPAARWWRALLALFMATMIAAMVVPIAWPKIGYGQAGAVLMALRMAQFLWLVILLPFMIGLTAIVLLRLLWRGIRWGGMKAAACFRGGAAEAPAAVPAQPPQIRLTRRQLLGAAAVMLPPLALGVAVGAALWQRGRFRIRRIRVPVPNLPEALDGMSIAHVTDTHVSRFLQMDDLPEIIARTNALGADLILFTGDLIDSGFGDLPALTAALKQMRPGAPGGLAMCVGNHDIMRDGTQFVREVKASGIPLLVDEALSLRVRGTGIQLLGLNWYRTDAALRAGVQRALSQFRRPDEFPILLAHHPHAFDAAVAAGLPLTLSGHTHGGQLMLTDHIGAGPILFRYWSGLYRRNGSSLVVSNGVGNWFPLRMNAPAEIVLVTLERVPARPLPLGPVASFGGASFGVEAADTDNTASFGFSGGAAHMGFSAAALTSDTLAVALTPSEPQESVR
jgi:predicted MPP superfamily phosphohydrolase